MADTNVPGRDGVLAQWLAEGDGTNGRSSAARTRRHRVSSVGVAQRHVNTASQRVLGVFGQGDRRWVNRLRQRELEAAKDADEVAPVTASGRAGHYFEARRSGPEDESRLRVAGAAHPGHG